MAAKIRLMKNFGFSDEDNAIYSGSNGKMTEACAAMGLTNLESLDRFIAINRSNYKAYQKGLAPVSGIELVSFDPNNQNNYQYIIIKIDQDQYGLTRDQLQQQLQKENILARRYFYPGCHRMEPYKSLYPNTGETLEKTNTFCEKVLVLPTGTQVSPEKIKLICRKIKQLCKHDLP